MLTEKEMLKIAENLLSEKSIRSQRELSLLNEHTIRKPYGNIYFFESKKFLETNDYNYALVGNAPFLVENTNGSIVVFGTSRDLSFYITEYEAGRWVSIQKK